VVLTVFKEKSECLTRESALVQRYEGLRRNRKAVLADLSSLVKTAKRLQELANGAPLEEEVEKVLDDMLLKSLKIVTRGVRFLDAWNEHVGLTRAILDLEPSEDNYDIPLFTPPTDTFSISERGGSAAGFAASERNWSRLDASRASTRTDVSDHPNIPSETNVRPGQTNLSLSPVSYTGPSLAHRNPNLASERLSASYDGFLGVLGSFIGLHCSPVSSTELIVTTQQSVQSCRALLSVVEAIWEHDFQRSWELEQAKDTMYERITELVHAARDAFRPNASDDEVVFMPDEGKRLVDAATDCVRGAGSCVAQARLVLEQIGDFEMDSAFAVDTPRDFDGPDKTPQPGHMGPPEHQHRPSLRLPPPHSPFRASI